MRTPARLTAKVRTARVNRVATVGRRTAGRADLARRKASASATNCCCRAAASSGAKTFWITTTSFGEWVRGDVLVEPEQVGRVEPLLRLDQPGVGRRRVRRPDLVRVGLTGEVHVHRVRPVRRDLCAGRPGPVDVAVEPTAV